MVRLSCQPEGKVAEDSAPYTHLAGRGPVAQTSSLLYRGFPIRQRCEVRKPCRLAAVAPKRRYGAPRRRKVGDTAGRKPALLPAYKMRVRCSEDCRTPNPTRYQDTPFQKSAEVAH